MKNRFLKCPAHVAFAAFLLSGLGLSSACRTVHAFPGSDFREKTCAEYKVSLDDLNRVEDASQYEAAEFSRWYESEAARPAVKTKGVALVIHGLNTKPSAMNAIVKLLVSQGYDVLRLSLNGHRGNLEEFKTVNRDRWLSEAFSGYCLAQERAKAQGVPVILAAFSLGGLVAEDLMNSPLKQPIEFQKAVLFAPAVSVNSKTQLIKVFRPLGDGYVVASRNLEDYRANWGTPMAGYNALFDSLDELEKTEFKRSNIPTLIFVDPDDELVDGSGLESIKTGHKLSSWEIVNVNNEGSLLPKKYHHLIIDASVVGAAQWAQMEAKIRGMLR